MIDDHKTTLKAECKQYESEYKQTVEEAEAAYKHAKKQAKEEMEHKMFVFLQREVDIILKSDEFANSDAKIKAKVESFVSWMNNASKSCGHRKADGKAATFAVEKQRLELIHVWG